MLLLWLPAVFSCCSGDEGFFLVTQTASFQTWRLCHVVMQGLFLRQMKLCSYKEHKNAQMKAWKAEAQNS